MKLSFIVLNYKTPQHLRLCLQNIEKLKLPFNKEVLVVDNHSQDNSAALVKNHFPAITIIETTQNIGHCAGNNLGIKQASGEYLLLINPDIIFHSSGDVEKMVQYLDGHSRVALLGPKLKNLDESVQNSCYRRYSLFTPLYRRTFLGNLPFGRRDVHRHLMLDFDHASTREVDWLLGACLMVRRVALAEIGLMDERFFLYFGDFEWCDRAWQHDWQVVYFHDTAGIYHYHKRVSASSRFSLVQTFSYASRRHMHDWLTYLIINRHV